MCLLVCACLLFRTKPIPLALERVLESKPHDHALLAFHSSLSGRFFFSHSELVLVNLGFQAQNLCFIHYYQNQNDIMNDAYHSCRLQHFTAFISFHFLSDSSSVPMDYPVITYQNVILVFS
jgi:hypothetical protein